MRVQVHTARAIPRRLSLLWWCGELESKLLTKRLITKHTLMGIYKVLNSCILNFFVTLSDCYCANYFNIFVLRLEIGARS